MPGRKMIPQKFKIKTDLMNDVQWNQPNWINGLKLKINIKQANTNTILKLLKSRMTGNIKSAIT